ncbi:MAG: DUF3175 domain-containing protein [Candidatus Margulisbacteria bacterium]|nr:DUF3175 domain-containing protein [Candidatus Margulisiibacteriota bacterium]
MLTAICVTLDGLVVGWSDPDQKVKKEKKPGPGELYIIFIIHEEAFIKCLGPKHLDYCNVCPANILVICYNCPMPKKYWSGNVTKKSNALDMEGGVFTL